MINPSLLLCLAGAACGFYVLLKDLKITKGNIKTETRAAVPVIIGTLAWLSAAFAFYDFPHPSPINFERGLMIISWVWLARQYRGSYLTKNPATDG